MKEQLQNNEWSLFSSIQTVAYYSPLGDYIMLNKVNETTLSEILNTDKLSFDNIKNISIINHEWQHWVDYTSTLWGMKKMVNMYNAYNAWLNGKESEFLHIKILFNEFKQDKYYYYYTQVKNKIYGNGKDVWKMGMTIGHRFNEDGQLNMKKPLLLVNFASSADIDIARVPVSIASMLECNAMFQELATKSLFIESLEENDKIIEILELDRYIYKWLYDPNMILYTVVTHLTANTLRINRPLMAIHIASIISNLVLNLPEKAIRQMKLPVTALLHGQAGVNMFSNRDKGYLFFLILENYAIEHPDKLDFVVDDLLKSSNLPNPMQLEEIILDEINSYTKTSAIDGPLNDLMMEKINTGKILLNIKGSVLNRQSSITTRDLLANKIDFPNFLCSDTYIDTEHLSINKIINNAKINGKIDYNEWYKIYEFCEPKFREFVEVCGV
ncbi:hypothetical protein IC231_16895 [Hymenobacter sp. BT646]|uniref:Uncharacterized protein n=2 Tax=Hymenobacter duratus TaxID=2771356 RepID=A0ABR8JLX2_9BACT|nr:hypothetical protein [Hymenobacter duratus]